MTIAVPLLSAAIAACAALTIRAEQRGARRGMYVFKPLTTVLTAVLALTMPEVVSERYQALICIGLLFSLAGDVFLMLPRNRFVTGPPAS